MAWVDRGCWVDNILYYLPTWFDWIQPSAHATTKSNWTKLASNKKCYQLNTPYQLMTFLLYLGYKVFFCVFLRSDQFLHTSTYVYFIYPRLIHLDILSYLNFLNAYASFPRNFRWDKALAIALSKHNHFTHIWKLFTF